MGLRADVAGGAGTRRGVVRSHYSHPHPMRMVGVFATCEGSQDDGGAVAESDGEHGSKVR